MEGKNIYALAPADLTLVNHSQLTAIFFLATHSTYTLYFSTAIIFYRWMQRRICLLFALSILIKYSSYLLFWVY